MRITINLDAPLKVSTDEESSILSVPLPPPAALLARAKKLGAISAGPSPFSTLAQSVEEKPKRKAGKKRARK